MKIAASHDDRCAVRRGGLVLREDPWTATDSLKDRLQPMGHRHKARVRLWTPLFRSFHTG